MKTIKMIFAAALLILASVTVKAQDKTDFFVGKWECLTVGTPGGDGKSTIVLKRNTDGKLTGALYSVTSTGNENPFSRVDEKAKSVTVYFKANGYDVYIYLEKVDDNNLTGSTMDMFDTTAKRVVEKG
ncbi:hypothetical protein [Flavobacterium limnophilum]|uniref:hypothetical protein n=1 Tax=Flavobacterium limnophilum TaxID=3003262 RepID=UPI00248298EF|nr:hypothetical protein [Flavobacterium limnophilum]